MPPGGMARGEGGGMLSVRNDRRIIGCIGKQLRWLLEKMSFSFFRKEGKVKLIMDFGQLARSTHASFRVRYEVFCCSKTKSEVANVKIKDCLVFFVPFPLSSFAFSSF